MAGPDTWDIELKCPTCGASGLAEVSDYTPDVDPLRPRGTLKVNKLPEGFRVRQFGTTMRTTKFECVRCGVLTQR